jgi:transcriptional regulator with XRE-family HTH domain
MTISPSSSAKEAKRALGARMREVRRDAGLTARALAQLTEQHYTRVSKIENGTQVPTDKDILTWCTVCQSEEQAPELIATARAVESAYLEYRRQARAGVKRALGPFTMERFAATMTFRIYEHNLIPQLFQTPAYCGALMSFWIEFLEAPNDRDAAVTERMRRQEILTWRGRTIRVVLEEQALRTWTSDATVHAGQLGRLLEAMGNPSVRLGIVPLMTRRSSTASTPFLVFDDDLVGLETPSATIEVTRPDEIALYVKLFDRLEGDAVYGGAARGLIIKALDDMP